MLLLLLLPILVSGYIICYYHPKHYYRLHRYEGQLLYLKAAHLGLQCLIFSSSIALLFNFYIPSKVHIFGFHLPVDIISILSIGVGEAIPTLSEQNVFIISWGIILSTAMLINARLYCFLSVRWQILKFKQKWGGVSREDEAKYKAYLMSGILKDSPMDSLFLDSMLKRRVVLISLETRKIYIGIIDSLGEPNEKNGMDQEVSLVPIMSGFREKDTLDTKLTINYKIIDGNDTIDDLSINIKYEQIISASYFDFDIYSRLNSKKD